MARTARKKSEFLHVILRGVAKQIIFENDTDRYFFLKLMRKYKDEQEVVIEAYCLMNNHVHLLIHDPRGNISDFMKKLGLSYALYFNNRYERVGHLFQNRYKSEIITDDKSHLTVYRYILNNPVKAGLGKAAEYRWNSYREYGTMGITDSSIIAEKIGSKEKLDEFLLSGEDDNCMEDISYRHNDEWALKVIHDELHVESMTAIRLMPKNERNELLAMMKEKGMSVRQIERLTGVNRGVVQNA